jgi:plasmid maintenance system antidote protein VapI
MKMPLEILKGIHPGFFLERELKKRGIAKSRFALQVGEYPQTFVAITKGKRKMNTPLALRIEQALNLEEGFLMTLQVFHEIAQEKKRGQKTPDLSKLGKSLFWDTNINTIDWQKYKRAVIERVFERGDDEEKKEITRFYGEDIIRSVLNAHER